MKASLRKTIQTYDEIVKQYVGKTKRLEPLKELKKFKKLLPKNALVLDAGCGWGRDSKILSEKFDVIGIDLSKGLLKYAKKYAPKARFLYGNILKIDFDNEVFDGIWSNVTLIHLEREDIIPALKEFYCVLKKGGVGYVSFKKGEGKGYKSEDMSGGNPRFYTWFNQKEIKKYLKKAGFKLIDIYTFSEKKRLGLKRNLGVINCFFKKK